MLYPIQTVLFQEFPYHLNVNATLYCKYNTQRILTPGDLNWVQHWVGRIGLLFISGAFHYTEPPGQRPLGLTNGKWNASEPKLRPNWLFSSGVPRAAPHIRKCGNLPIRQNLVIMWPYTERASDRPSASQGNQCLLSHFVASWGAQEKTNCTSILWSIDSCQNRVSADEYHLTVSPAQVSTHRGGVFVEVIRWQFASFKWSQAQVYFFQWFIWNMLCLCHYGPARLGFWFQTDLGSENWASFLKIQAEKTFSYQGHALVTLYVQFLCSVHAENLCSITLQHLESCLLWQLKLNLRPGSIFV